jgi:hypothetical protein
MQYELIRIATERQLQLSGDRVLLLIDLRRDFGACLPHCSADCGYRMVLITLIVSEDPDPVSNLGRSVLNCCGGRTKMLD